MNTTLSIATAEAVEILQSRAMQAQSGSDSEQIAEVAVSYCIERARSEDEVQFIVYDCQRNAKFVYGRSLGRGRGAIAAYARQTYGPTVVVNGELDVKDRYSVEDEVAANNSEFCDCALDRARTLGPMGPAFVRRLMVGDTLAEAAVRVGISRATANRWRSTLATDLAAHRYLAEVAE